MATNDNAAKAKTIVEKLAKDSKASLMSKISAIGATTVQKVPPNKKDVAKYQANATKVFAAAESEAIANVKATMKKIKLKKG
jgi:hypothetical protein